MKGEFNKNVTEEKSVWNAGNEKTVSHIKRSVQSFTNRIDEGEKKNIWAGNKMEELEQASKSKMKVIKMHRWEFQDSCDMKNKV